jgi:hypothetical protein
MPCESHLDQTLRLTWVKDEQERTPVTLARCFPSGSEQALICGHALSRASSP